jgi:predicted nucleic acid-binding Zn ribbon protein
MTQETVGYVRLEWTCKRCGGKNPGPEKLCVHCGASLDEQDQFELPETQEFITDAEELKKAAAGPDIHCPYCETRNPAGSTVCKQCGGSLDKGVVRARGQIVGAPPVTRPPAKPRAAPRPAVASKVKGLPWYLFAGLAVLLLVCCVGAYVLARPSKEINGVVRDVSWERRISVEALQPVSREDWRDEIPSDARLGNCRKKHHHTQSEEPSAGMEAEKICGTPYTIDQGSGYGKVVQDCEYKVYADWCEYTREEWQEIDASIASGYDSNPYWPQVNLASGQREGERSERYNVNFDTEGKSYDYHPRNADEFSSFDIGSKWVLSINALGGVTAVEPR